MSLAGGIVTAAVLAVSRLAGERLTYGARYYLGTAAAVVFLVPMLITGTADRTEPTAAGVQQTGNAAVQSTEPAQEAAGDASEAQAGSAAADTAAVSEGAAYTAMEGTAENYENMRLEELLREFESSAFPIRASKSELYINVLAVVWLFGAAVLLGKMIVGAAWFRVKIFCFSHPAPAEKCVLFEEIKGKFGIKRRIRLRVFMGDMSPFITGIIFNTVYIPENADEETLRLVLRHELVHCKRFDLLYKSLTELAAAVHFFNPFAHLLKRYVNKFCELSCDEAAVGEMCFDDRKQYTLAMLTMIKKSRYRLRGAAALGERKSNLRERVEFIMKNKAYSKKCRLASRVTVAAALAVSMATGIIAQAQNTAEPPQVSYASDDVYVDMSASDDFEYNGMNYNLNIMCDDETSVFTDMLGFTRFYASWSAQSVSILQENRDQLVKNGDDAWFEWLIEQDDNRPDFYEVELTSVVDRQSYVTENIEGLARLSRNGEMIAEDLPIYINRTPGSGSFRYQTYSTDVILPKVTIDGETVNIRITPRYYDVTTEDRIEYESVRYNFERSRSTKEVFISEVDELTIDGKTYTDYPCERTISYNPMSQNADMSLSVRDEDFTQIYADGEYSSYAMIDLNVYVPAEVTEDSITADFSVTPAEENAKENYYEVESDVKRLTLTGLDGSAGDTVEISSADGSVSGRLIIGTAPKEETYLKGTRDVSEFITEGEDYFVGTPAEQEDFDRDEHSKYYKRIVVDDEGKVIYVIPAELQMTEALNDAVARMDSGDTTYQTTMSYESMPGALERCEAVVLIDRLTWWPKAILTKENCFAAPDETNGIIVQVD